MAFSNNKRSSKHYPDSSFNDDIELTRSPSYGKHRPHPRLNRTMTREGVNVFIVFIFILELLVLVFLSVLEYFLRATDVFPVRKVKFSCNDEEISYTEAISNYDDFAYDADISYEVVLGLSFTIPPFVMIVCEIAFWAFNLEQQKTVRVLFKNCKVPQVIRRIIRYIGAFIFGILVTMIFTDVAKIFTGRLRPTFLETCLLNQTMCDEYSDDKMFDSNVICLQEDEMKLREARLSFPSLHTSITAFSAFFLAIYIHNIIRNPGVRIMRPFLALSFVILSIMCGLARLGLRYSHWTDVLAGFLLGFFVAAYLCIYVLSNFRERPTDHQLYATLRNYLVQHRLIELRDLYKENWTDLDYFNGVSSTLPIDHSLQSPQYTTNTAAPSSIPDAYSNGMAIPRPRLHSNETSTDIIEIRPRTLDRANKPKPQFNQKNTFQRDLHKAVDNYRSTRDLYPQNGGHF